jgi:hypothetical protein
MRMNFAAINIGQMKEGSGGIDVGFLSAKQ